MVQVEISSPENPGAAKTGPARRYDIDWLRVGTIGLVFLFHSARFFDPWPWHVKNGQTSMAAALYAGALLQVIMPMFFVLSGISTYYAIGALRQGFLRERARRLVVPLLFGILVLSPHQIYLERLTHGQTADSFFAWLPSYFNDPYLGNEYDGNFAWFGVHLWYLLFLFLFSVMMLPLFLWLRAGRGQRLAGGLVTALAQPGMLFAPVLLLALAEFATYASPVLDIFTDFGGWNPLVYLLLFVCGYLFLADDRLKGALVRQRRVSLVAGLLLLPAYFAVTYLAPWQDNGVLLEPIAATVRAADMWAWLMALLGLGIAHLSFDHRWLRRANEGVLPFYMLHQPVILLVGFVIVQWDLPMIVKYLLIMAASLPVILGAYEFIVRRVGFLRFLFGLKVERGGPGPQSSQVRAAGLSG
ncbi:MAG: acyltransferase family protein [Bacteroidetes bacterium]|nr:acyltransferase family protein [Bacteroidota bacterium]MCL5025210.1 acyltransferase family protein [Chloroflexota bacterium]